MLIKNIFPFLPPPPSLHLDSPRIESELSIFLIFLAVIVVCFRVLLFQEEGEGEVEVEGGGSCGILKGVNACRFLMIIGVLFRRVKSRFGTGIGTRIDGLIKHFSLSVFLPLPPPPIPPPFHLPFTFPFFALKKFISIELI